MGEPGQRSHSNGQPLGHNYAGALQYQGAGHPAEPRRSSIQSMLNPSSPDPVGSYAYYSGPHGAHPPPHQMQQQQQPYLHSIKQPPAPGPQQQQQHPQHHHQQQHPHHPEQHQHDERYPPQPYHYQQQQPLSHQPPPQHQHQQQQPQQQQIHHHHHQQPSHVPHHHHSQPSAQHQGYYPSQASSVSSMSSSSLGSASTSSNALAYSGSASSLPSISQPQFRSSNQYSPGTSPSEPTFQAPLPSAIQGPSATSLHAHHQQPPVQQQRHHHHGSISSSASIAGGVHPHPGHLPHTVHSGVVPTTAGSGSGSMPHGPPRRSSGESPVDIRLQSPPAPHYGHASSSHLAARAPSPPRASATEFTRSRQSSVSGHGFHGDYRSHVPGPDSPAAAQGAHYEYAHHYSSAYSEAPFPGSHRPSASQQQQQHQQHQQHHQYAPQYSQHSSPGYMRSSAPEIDRPHAHSVSVPQHYHQGYPPQPPSPPQHPQPPLVSPPPPHRSSMQDLHAGVPRTASTVQHPQQQHQPHQQERPHAENDEAIVASFMSKMQMQQQQQSHGQKQAHKTMQPPPIVPQPQPAQQQHHLQQPQQHRHHPYQQQQQLQSPPLPPQHHQQSQPHHLHLEPSAHRVPEPEQHVRYAHGDRHGYQHGQEAQSPVYRTAPAELSRSMTPPSHGHPSLRLGPAVDARQRPMSTSTPGLASLPIPGIPAQSYPARPSDTPKKLSTSGSQPSLPPRSISLLLNAEETEANGDTTETEEEEDTRIVLQEPPHTPLERAYSEHYQPYAQPQEHEERLVLPTIENPSVEIPVELEQVEHHEGAIAKPIKEKPARPVKEKVVKEKPVKVVKEKVVKEKIEKVKKERGVKMPPKKKASVASAALSGTEPTETAPEITVEQAAKPTSQATPDVSTGRKHSVDEHENERKDVTVKKSRVDDRPTLQSEKSGQSPNVTLTNRQQEEPSSTPSPISAQRLDSPRTKFTFSGKDDEVQKRLDMSVQLEQRSTRVQESPRQKTDVSRAPNIPTTVDTAVAGRSRSSTPSSTPTSGSFASRYRPTPETDAKDETNPGSPHTPLTRETIKVTKPATGVALPSIKDKKPSKKKIVVESAPSEEAAIPPMVANNHAASQKEIEDVDMEPVDTKTPSKSASGSKKVTAAKVIPTENVQPTIKQDKAASAAAEIVRDKPSKPKRIADRAEPSPNAGSKTEGSSKGLQVSSKTKDNVSPPSSLTKEDPASREVLEQGKAEDDEGLYCICRTPYNPARFMIGCDGGCEDWFHGDCVGIEVQDSEMVDKYYCKRCEEKGRHGSQKKKCLRESCQKPVARKSKYCSKECGLLVATLRIQESQARVFGAEEPTETDGQHSQHEHAHQQLQRRRRLTLADLDDRQRLLGIREKMEHVSKVCSILDGREKQLELCVDRQARQDLGKLVSSSALTATDKEGEKVVIPAEEEGEQEESAPRTGSKAKAKGRSQKAKDKEKDKEAFCGFDYSLVWDDVQDMSRVERAALSSSLATTPAGSRASSVAPPSFGAMLVTSKKQAEERGSSVLIKAFDCDVGLHVCMSRRNCDRHNGWQKLKAAELDLEKTLQNKLLRTLKAEAKLVKNRMKRRRNDLSAGILNGTIEH